MATPTNLSRILEIGTVDEVFGKRPTRALHALAAWSLLIASATSASARTGLSPTPVTVSVDVADEAARKCLGEGIARPLIITESHGAVNPRNRRNLVAAWMLGDSDGRPFLPGVRSPVASRFVVQASASFDGGHTWSPAVTLPFTTCAGAPTTAKLDVATDPWVAFGADGRAYVSAQAYEGPAGGHGGIQHISVVASSDGGRSWSTAPAAMRLQGPGVKTDNTAIEVSPTREQLVFVLTTHAGQALPTAGRAVSESERSAPAALARSFDGGRTWGPMQIITPQVPEAYADLPQMVADPRTGRLFVLYSNPRPARDPALGPGIWIVTSEDDGEVWSAPMRVSDYVSPERSVRLAGGLDRLLGNAALDVVRMAVDPTSGTICVVFVDGRHEETRIPQVSLTSSRDGGRTWSVPARLSTESESGAFLPAVAVSAAGDVAVSYFDFDVKASGRERIVQAWLAMPQLDADGTITAVSRRRLDRFPWLPISPEGFFIGDYVALLSLEDGFGLLHGKMECGGTSDACRQGLATQMSISLAR